MTIETAIALIAIALAAAACGGAIGGILIAGKDIGNGVAAMLGAFYGPIAGLFGVGLGVVVLWTAF